MPTGKKKQERLAFGVDVGGTRTKYGLVELSSGEIRAQTVLPTASSGTEAFITALEQALDELADQAGIERHDCLGLGIGVPGAVIDDDISEIWKTLAFLNGDSLHPLLEDRLGMPVRLDNDARLVALGEANYGSERGAGRLLSLTLGTGLGFGFVVDGRLQEANSLNHMAGHILIRPGTETCYCGLSGCLESLVSADGLVKAYLEASSQTGLSSEPLPDPQEIFTLATQGNSLAVSTVGQWLEDLSQGLNVYCYLFAPQVIVLGGGLAKNLTPYLAGLQSRLFARPFAGYNARLSISQLGEKAGILGAAALFTP